MAFVSYPHAALSRPAVPRPVDDALRATGARLLSALVEAQAYGLAGAHIGEAEPVIAINLAAEPAPRDDRVFYNPRVLAAATEQQAGTEGSVSLPGLQVQINRPVWAEIGFDDADGKPQALRLEGFVARCALHEIEQMDGRFFLDNLSRLKRDMALKKFAKLQR